MTPQRKNRVTIPKPPSVEEWLKWMRNALDIWKGFGEGKNEELRRRLSKFYLKFKSATDSTFKSYLYKRVAPEHAKLLRAFGDLFHEIDPRFTAEQYEALIRHSSPNAQEPFVPIAWIPFRLKPSTTIDSDMKKRVERITKKFSNNVQVVISPPRFPDSVLVRVPYTNKEEMDALQYAISSLPFLEKIAE